MIAVSLGLALPATAGYAISRTPDHTPVMRVTVTTTRTVTVTRKVVDKKHVRQLQAARRQLRRRWWPTIDYALHLASAVSGVSYWQLRAVSWCESRWQPFATNGRYKGIFQLGWLPFGLSPFDPIANALSAALTVAHDGGWRQWECQP